MDSDDMVGAPSFFLKSHLNPPIPLANTGGRPQLSTGWLRVGRRLWRAREACSFSPGRFLYVQIREEGPRSLKARALSPGVRTNK
jgi:hypothetical protein